MAQIGNVRRFDGVDDYIQLAVDTIASASLARTWAAIVKLTTNTGFHSILSRQGGGAEWSFQHQDDDLSMYGPTPQVNSPDGWIPNGIWCLLAFSRADGAGVTGRWHRYRYDTTTWTHTDDDVTHDETGDPSGGNLWIGTYDGTSEFAAMDLAVLGSFDANLSDGQLEGLTSAISAWDALAAQCWLLDQNSASIALTDRIANCDQIAINGTTAISESGLAFDVGGGGGGVQATPRTIFHPLRW